MEIGSIREIVRGIASTTPIPGEASVFDAAYGVLYEQTLRRADPSGRPVVNEEGPLRDVPDGARSWWTVDPTDGSRRFEKLHWLDCLGTMLGRVTNEEIDAGYVSSFGGEGPGMIGFEPGRPLAHYDYDGNVRPLGPIARSGKLPLLVRAAPGRLTPTMRSLLRAHDTTLVHGSIGLSMFPLWLGEACGMVLPLPYHTEMFWTPWDTTPVYGICQQLNIRAYRMTMNGLVEYPLTPLRTSQAPRELLLAHVSYVEELQAAAA